MFFFYLQVVMLSLLFSLQVQSCQPSQILLTHSLINSCSSPYSFSVVMRGIRPPISFHFNVTQYHVFNWNRQARNLQNKIYNKN